MPRYEYGDGGEDDGYRPGPSTHYSPGPETFSRSDSGYRSNQLQSQQPPVGLNESYYRDAAQALGLPPTPDAAQPRSQPQLSSDLVRAPSRQSGNSRSSSTSSHRDRGFDDDRDRNFDDDRDRAGYYTPDPLERTRDMVHDSFSHTSTGLGVGLLGAVVGGIVASKASEAAFKQRRASSHGRRNDGDGPARLLTVLGAVAGGLGANAVARKVECDRERHRQRMWQGQYGSDDDLGRYSSSRWPETPRRGRLLDDADADDYVYDERRYTSRRRHHHLE